MGGAVIHDISNFSTRGKQMASHSAAVSLASKVSLDQRGCLNPKLICSAKEDIYCCDINPSGDLLAASLSDGTCMLFETRTGSIVYKLSSINAENLPAVSIEFRPQSSEKSGLQNVLLVAYSSGHVKQWHPATGKTLSVVNEARQTLVGRYAPDVSTFSTSGSDHKIMVYDASTSALVKTLQQSVALTKMDGHQSRVFAIRYHPTNPHLLISAGWDNTVQFWDTRVDSSVRKITGPHICGNSLDIDPTTLNIVTGSWRQRFPLEIWDFNTGKLLSTSSSCIDTKLYSACWMDNNHVLVGGSLRHRALAVDTINDCIIGDVSDVLGAGVYNVVYNGPTKTAAIASADRVHLCSVTLPKRNIFYHKN